MLIARGKGGEEKWKRAKRDGCWGWRVNGVEGDIILGNGPMMQYLDNDLLSCTLETYKLLLTNVIPINLIKKEKERKLHLLKKKIQ